MSSATATIATCRMDIGLLLPVLIEV